MQRRSAPSKRGASTLPASLHSGGTTDLLVAKKLKLATTPNTPDVSTVLFRPFQSPRAKGPTGSRRAPPRRSRTTINYK